MRGLRVLVKLQKGRPYYLLQDYRGRPLAQTNEGHVLHRGNLEDQVNPQAYSRQARKGRCRYRHCWVLFGHKNVRGQVVSAQCLEYSGRRWQQHFDLEHQRQPEVFSYRYWEIEGSYYHIGCGHWGEIWPYWGKERFVSWYRYGYYHWGAILRYCCLKDWWGQQDQK